MEIGEGLILSMILALAAEGAGPEPSGIPRQPNISQELAGMECVVKVV
jgi:hypothetical protein